MEIQASFMFAYKIQDCREKVFNMLFQHAGCSSLGGQSAELAKTGKGSWPLKIPGYEARHKVRPGLTGLAPVYAPRDIPRRHKFKYDLLYIQRQTFWLDRKLIALSFWITFRGKWEYRGQKF
jgi:hypothetical protein